MTRAAIVSLFLLRVVLGWLFFYAGVTKVLAPGWSAAGYLAGAKTFPGFYALFLNPAVLPVVNFVNEWGLLLVGVSLILGIAVRASSLAGMALMLLYYFPVLAFPYPNANSLIVDEHIVYAAALLVLFVFRAGRAWGLERRCASLPLCSRFPLLRAFLG